MKALLFILLLFAFGCNRENNKTSGDADPRLFADELGNIKPIVSLITSEGEFEFGEKSKNLYESKANSVGFLKDKYVFINNKDDLDIQVDCTYLTDCEMEIYHSFFISSNYEVNYHDTKKSLPNSKERSLRESLHAVVESQPVNSFRLNLPAGVQLRLQVGTPNHSSVHRFFDVVNDLSIEKYFDINIGKREGLNHEVRDLSELDNSISNYIDFSANSSDRDYFLESNIRGTGSGDIVNSLSYSIKNYKIKNITIDGVDEEITTDDNKIISNRGIGVFDRFDSAKLNRNPMRSNYSGRYKRNTDALTVKLDESSFNLNEFDKVDLLNVEIEIEFKNGIKRTLTKSYELNKDPSVLPGKIIKVTNFVHERIMNGTLPKPNFNYYVDNDNSGNQSEGDQLVQIFNKSFSMSFIGDDIDNDDRFPNFYDKNFDLITDSEKSERKAQVLVYDFPWAEVAKIYFLNGQGQVVFPFNGLGIDDQAVLNFSFDNIEGEEIFGGKNIVLLKPFISEGFEQVTLKDRYLEKPKIATIEKNLNNDHIFMLHNFNISKKFYRDNQVDPVEEPEDLSTQTNYTNVINFRRANNVEIEHGISPIHGTQVNLGSYGSSLEDQLYKIEHFYTTKIRKKPDDSYVTIKKENFYISDAKAISPGESKDLTHIECSYNENSSLLDRCTKQSMSLDIGEENGQLLQSDQIGLRDFRFVEFSHDGDGEPELITFWGGVNSEAPTRMNQEFESVAAKYAPSFENNKELVCVHGKLHSIVRSNKSLSEEDRDSEKQVSCFLYQLSSSGQSRFDFKYGKLVILKENELLGLNEDLVAYSFMIKDFSDNKNKYFIKDTNFNIPNEGYGEVGFMLSPIYEEAFDFERNDNDPYFYEIDNIDDEKACHFPYSNVSFCPSNKFSSLKGDTLNIDFSKKKLFNSRSIFVYDFFKYEGLNQEDDDQKNIRLPIIFSFGKNKNINTYSSRIYIPSKRPIVPIVKPFLAYSEKSFFINDKCVWDQDCDFYNFLPCDVDGLCDDGEKWFNHQLQKPRSCISGFCAFKAPVFTDNNDCLSGENCKCDTRNDCQGTSLCLGVENEKGLFCVPETNKGPGEACTYNYDIGTSWWALNCEDNLTVSNLEGKKNKALEDIDALLETLILYRNYTNGWGGSINNHFNSHSHRSKVLIDGEIPNRSPEGDPINKCGADFYTVGWNRIKVLRDCRDLLNEQIINLESIINFYKSRLNNPGASVFGAVPFSCISLIESLASLEFENLNDFSKNEDGSYNYIADQKIITKGVEYIDRKYYEIVHPLFKACPDIRED
jgi:hypothetical protein